MSPVRPLIRAILIDLSGTLHIGDKPTPNAVEALRRLRQARVPFRFCSNTSRESTNALRKRLFRMGFEARSDGVKEEIWTSIGAVKRTLENQGLKRPYFLLSPSARDECSGAAGYSDDEPYDAVVVGLAPYLFTYDHLNSAFQILVGEHETQRSAQAISQQKIPLIASHKAKYIRSPDGGLSLGPGPFVAALETASGKEAQVVGKPSRDFFEVVIGNFAVDEVPSRDDPGYIAVVGDDIEADLGEGAVQLGLWRVLVKTGKYRLGDEHRSGVQPPDEVCESFASFVDSLLGSSSSRL